MVYLPNDFSVFIFNYKLKEWDQLHNFTYQDQKIKQKKPPNRNSEKT